MENLILVFEETRPSQDEVAAALRGLGKVDVQDDQLVVRQLNRCVVVEPNDHPASWWLDDWSPGLVRASPKALVVAYRHVELAKLVVAALGDQYRCVVDTAADGVYPGVACIQRCAAEPGWNSIEPAAELTAVGRGESEGFRG